MEHKSYYPKTGLTEYAVKAAELIFGLFLFAAGGGCYADCDIDYCVPHAVRSRPKY